MKRNLKISALASFALLLALSTSAHAAEDGGTVFVPSHYGWVQALILAIVWLFVAAILLGPIVAYFRVEPPPEPVLHHNDSHADPHAHAAAPAHH